MSLERYRPSMSGVLLHSWATIAQSEIDRLNKELDHYRSGVELEGVIEREYAPDGTSNGEGMLVFDMPKQQIGRRVRVLVMKEVE